MKCSYCGSSNLQSRGMSVSKLKRRYYCKDCGRYPSYPLFQLGKADDSNSNAKVLIYDIETAPMIVYTWRLKTDYISPKHVINDIFIISWAAKWLGDNEIMSDVVTPAETKRRSDKRVVKSFLDLLNEADIVVAHNGDRFDMSILKTRFLENGFNPPLPFRSIDTLKSTRRVFGFTSNTLDYLTNKLNIGKKIETNFQLWVDCSNGIKTALDEMVTYNRMDVEILEDWYMKIRNWIPNHPNMNMYSDDKNSVRCPVCSGEIEILNKVVTTKANSWKTYRCKSCGSTGRTKLNAMTKEEKRFFIVR